MQRLVCLAAHKPNVEQSKSDASGEPESDFHRVSDMLAHTPDGALLPMNPQLHIVVVVIGQVRADRSLSDVRIFVSIDFVVSGVVNDFVVVISSIFDLSVVSKPVPGPFRCAFADSQGVSRMFALRVRLVPRLGVSMARCFGRRWSSRKLPP